MFDGAGLRMAAGNLVQGALFTVMVVRAGMLRDPAFEQELPQQVERSPRFFLNAPVVLDLKGADGFHRRAANSSTRARLLRRHTLALVGVQNAQPAQIALPPQPGSRALRQMRRQPSRRAARAAAGAGRSRAGRAAAPAPRAPARLVTEPVRSGTQIYARGTDLIVTAAVSAGAELVADGNIHVYGALRGRALAGASGDVDGANLLHPARGRAGQHRRPLSRQRAIAAGTAGFGRCRSRWSMIS